MKPRGRVVRRFQWSLVPLLLMLPPLAGAAVLQADSSASISSPPPSLTSPPPPFAHAADETSRAEDVAMVEDALLGLAVAGGLGAALAFRPRRRGTPPRKPAVIQTQIILALVGALVMIVVGASLARAFGIVGAASLVRYRAKVDDPKDAGVMLACLALGLASGVGIYAVAVLSTLVILAVVWALESLEPEGRKDFLLKVEGGEPEKLKERLEELLRRNRIKHELRTTSKDDLVYTVELPLTKRTDRLTDAILALDKGEQLKVQWSDKKGKDNS